MTASLWRNRGFLAVWGGQLVSTLGSRISATAMPLLVLATTGSPAAAGVVAAAAAAPTLLLSLPFGALADRWPRRRLMIGSELVAAAAYASVVVAVLAGRATVVHLAVAAFIAGAGTACYGVAEHAALPQIVPAALLPAALAQNESKTRGAGLAGPPLGGLLFGLGAAVPFLADVVSYLVAACGLTLVRDELRPARSGVPGPGAGPGPGPGPGSVSGSLLSDVAVGLSFVWRHGFVRAALLLIASSNLIFQAVVLVLVVLATDRGATPSTIGLMFGIYSAGGLLGALVAGPLLRLLKPRGVMIGVNWAWAALLPLFAVVPHPLLLGVVGAATAFLGPAWNVMFGAYTLLLVPDDMRGRVASAASTVAGGALPLGSLAAGLLLDRAGAIPAVLVLSAAMTLTAVAATATRAVRQAPALQEAVN